VPADLECAHRSGFLDIEAENSRVGAARRVLDEMPEEERMAVGARERGAGARGRATHRRVSARRRAGRALRRGEDAAGTAPADASPTCGPAEWRSPMLGLALVSLPRPRRDDEHGRTPAALVGRDTHQYKIIFR